MKKQRLHTPRILLIWVSLVLPVSAIADQSNPLTSAHKQPQTCPKVYDSILIATGNGFHTQTDHERKNFLGLHFTRYYNSTAPAVNAGIGTKWRHNFARHISLSGTGALAYRNNGQVFAFNYNGTNWQGDADIPNTLVAMANKDGTRTGWLYTTAKDAIEQYNAAGQLIQVTNRLGKTQNFIYDMTTADGGDSNSTTLDKVTGFQGDTMTFGYTADTPYPESITSMTGPNGQTYRYAYDAAGNLRSVTYPDSTPNNNKDSLTRLYHYENTAFPHQLTGVTDKAGRRDIDWAYGSQGRAISTELVNAGFKSTVTYNTDGSVTVTNHLGRQTTYQFTTLHGVKKLTQITGYLTVDCNEDYTAYTYDANGFLASKTSRQGAVTAYQHNGKGQETSRTEAAGTTEARTVATQWHADFNVPVKIVEPGKTLEFKYDDRGKLISQIIRSTP